MRLSDLEPRFVKRIDDRSYQTDGVAFEEADGVLFLCPKCFAENGGSQGTHSILCWRPRVPQTVSPKPGRWEFQGAGVGDLTLVAGSSSVLLTSGCHAHFFIRNGNIEGC
jgi:hypothetical protein